MEKSFNWIAGLVPKCAVLFGLTYGILACTNTKDAEPMEGMWRAELEVMDGETLPFNFDLSKNSKDEFIIQIYNDEEVINVDEIILNKDSIHIKTPVFEGYIAGTYTENSIRGSFIKESLDRIVPFKAKYGISERFDVAEQPKMDVSGIWETKFNTGTDDAYMAKGIFTQNGTNVSGTFRTTTGDYRYLDGVMDGTTLKLSTFDGAHAFLFTAKVTDSTLKGTFYSGNHSKESFVGRRNSNFELPNEEELTFLREGYDQLNFSFPDAAGNMISLQDDRYQDKVVIVQIMGTWCPNCLDETKFLVDYKKQLKSNGFEVLALAFEYAKTKEGAFKGIDRLRERLGIDYPILLAQYGTSNKIKAQEKLPMLNHVLSYPTTIFIDKKGSVRKIHTGFNGPATGEKYEAFISEFDSFVSELLNEGI